MPWQQHVADVIMEIDGDSGELAYPEVGLTVPRQSGKSTLILAKAVHRCMATKFFGTRRRVVYTAQTRHKAREKWEEDYAGTLEESRTFAGRVRVHRGNGNEHIRFPNGSRFGIESTTEKAGHGPTIDEAYIDEAFAQADGRAEQAFRPAMITRTNKQLLWVSTRGWKGREPYLLPKIERGRALVEMGQRHGLAYFEWSAPDGSDALDRALWRATMPALGHTITESAIEAELLTMGLPDFCRAYLNMSVVQDEGIEWAVIGREPWLARLHRRVRPTGPVVFAVSSSWPDAAWTSVSVVGQFEGRLLVQVLEHRAGSSWAVEELKRLTAEHPSIGVAIDPGGPTGALVAPLEAAGLGESLIKASAADTARAYGVFCAEVSGDRPRLGHLDQPELNEAVRVAQKRTLGDGFTWARKGDDVDITPVESATLGVWAYLSKAHLAEPVRSAYEDRGFVEL